MSKLNQIQNKILELDGGVFQKLADAYLHRKGYEQINSVGSLIGANKVRKGTPDSFMPLPNKKYVFAEYTTQREDLYNKLDGDLTKCFDEDKTGLPINKIAEVVFCHISDLDIHEVNRLTEKCQQHGVNLNIFGIGPISFDLYQKYPSLAKDCLGVEVDTGQIVQPPEFVETYNKNKLATRLDTNFHFRETELDQILQGLETDHLIIIAGKAGVGKSRLALECINQYKLVHPEYEVRCIFNRGPDLFEDIRVHFSDSGHFLILVDDANRVSRFEYIVQLLQHQRADQQIKVIATVRDYALDKVRDVARSYKSVAEVELFPLEEAQIKQLIQDEYQILNHLYLDRIADIAKGNPRLAIMASEIARRENTLQSISNVTQLYDEYFASIRQDINQLNDQLLLKVAGTIAFLQYVDRTNEEIMNLIHDAFGISAEKFWEAAECLHQLEVVDMYENEVVRTADQVLATYMFHLIFFKERKLNFSSLLQYFFPRFEYRVIDVINPILNAFDTKPVMDEIRSHINLVWEKMVAENDHLGLLHLMNVFWFLKQTDTLLYIQDRIDEMEKTEVDIAELEFKPQTYISRPSMLSILASFVHTDSDVCEMALSLLMSYLAKRPQQMPEIIHILFDSFGFRHTSHFQGFSIQQIVVDTIWGNCQEGQHQLFTKLYLTIAAHYLQIHFHTHEPKGNHAIAIIDFDLPATPQIFVIRQTIWSNIFDLYKIDYWKSDVMSILMKSSQFGPFTSSKDILIEDAKVVLPLMRACFSPENYKECVVANHYLDLLSAKGILFDESLRTAFTKEKYELSELLISDNYERRYLKLSYEEYQEFKQRQIEEHFCSFNFNGYEHFFEICIAIQVELEEEELFRFRNGVSSVLLNLADRSPTLYVDVLLLYLHLKDPFSLEAYALIEKLILFVGIQRTHEIIVNSNCLTKYRWQFMFHQCLPEEAITTEYLEELYMLYRKSEKDLPRHIDFLLKYHAYDTNAIPKITQIILERAETTPNFIFALEMFFNPYTELNKRLLEIFKNEFPLLKKAYLAALEIGHGIDHNAHTLIYIIDLEPAFIVEYIDWLYLRKLELPRRNRIHDYANIWMHRDYKKLMLQVVERIYEHEQQMSLYWGSHLEDFFELKGSEVNNEEISNRQQQLLMSSIEDHCTDFDFMIYIFNIISNLEPEKRVELISQFLQKNESFELFQRLPMEPYSWTWSGSAVPMLQKRVEYFEALLPLLNKVKFLKHKQLIERQIHSLRNQIEYEKKKDFIGE